LKLLQIPVKPKSYWSG